MRDQADSLAGLIWERMNYWFLWVPIHAQNTASLPFIRYHSRYSHKRSKGSSARYMYHCAQSTEWQHAPSKKAPPLKKCDKIQMDTFKCHGWLHITLSKVNNVANIKIDHHDDHIPYVPIDIPEGIKELIINNPKWTPTQVGNILPCTYIDGLIRCESCGMRSLSSISDQPLQERPYFRYDQRLIARTGNGMKMS